jgi:hypothetical protein
MQRLDPATYAEALRTVETALEQARKAAGIREVVEQAQEEQTVKLILVDPRQEKSSDGG